MKEPVKPPRFSRREFATIAAGAVAGMSLPGAFAAAETQASDFSLNYILASCMYGYADVREIVPEVRKVGATALDIWPKVHGDQREQLEEMGAEAFAELLKSHGVSLGCITQYKLGPFGLKEEMRLAGRLGCGLIVTGGRGPKNLQGTELKRAVGKLMDSLRLAAHVVDLERARPGLANVIAPEQLVGTSSRLLPHRPVGPLVVGADGNMITCDHQPTVGQGTDRRAYPDAPFVFHILMRDRLVLPPSSTAVV